jgi:hypothetical protein
MNISADMRQGTRRDAILHAAGANAAHGLRRTNADKRRAVETLLRDEEWSKWSDREIARMCAVSQPLVSQIRKTLTDNIISEKTYTTKHGTTTTMDTSNVGKKQAPEPEEERTQPPAPEPQRPDLPPGWYWQNSSNPADIIAINRNNHEQTSGFCETHEQAAAAAWQVHLDGQRKPEPQYQRMNVRDVEKLGLIAGLDRDVALEMQRRGYFWGYYEKDDKGIVYSVYHHQGYRYRILLSNIPAFINQQPGHEALMMGVDVDAPAPTKQNYWQRIADLPAEQRNEMIERLESLGHDVQYIERTGELRNNLKGSAGHNTETIKLVSELEKRLEIAQENWDRHQQQIAERERIKQPELPEQQPVAHPTIRQCMIDAYRLINAGDKEGAHLQAQRFRAHPDIAGIIGHAIWGMQCAMEGDT